MTGREAFDQLKMKLRRVMQAYEEGDSSSLTDMAENGQFLYDSLEELVESAEKWDVADKEEDIVGVIDKAKVREEWL